MRTSIWSASALGALTLVTLLLGCGGGSQPAALAPSGGVQPSRRSSTSLEPGGENLVYVSNLGNDTVTIYSGARFIGTLNGFDNVASMCHDRAGNVFVVNARTSQIFEYTHSGDGPINVLSDPYGSPVACSVDLTTGNLAVTDHDSGVLIYANATGTPKRYSSSSFKAYFSPGYDDRGDLFVDGQPTLHASPLRELPKDGSELISIKLKSGLKAPTSLQWDGEYLAICDIEPQPNVIKQFSISGSTGTLAGTTTLDGTKRVRQFWVPKFGGGRINRQGTRVVAVDEADSVVRTWTYPAGGSSVKTIKQGISTPVGVTVSPGAH